MRCICSRDSSPLQCAPAIESSLTALILPVEGMCGPRQKSMNGVPSIVVAAHRLAALVFDQFALERLAHLGELRFGLGLRHLDAPVFEIALDQVAHALLDLRQILGREPPAVVALKVVIEAALRVVEQRRPDAQPRPRIEVEHGRRQQVRGRVAIDFQRLVADSGVIGFHALAIFDDVAKVYRLFLFDAVTIEARGDGLLHAIAILSFQNFKSRRAR